MMLLTKAIKEKLPKLYSQEHNEDPIVYVKFFNPCGSESWFFTEYDGVDIFFGKFFSASCPDGEFGYTSLKEIQNIKGPMGIGIERDTSFRPKPLSQCK
jgi:hypothetical protein